MTVSEDDYLIQPDPVCRAFLEQGETVDFFKDHRNELVEKMVNSNHTDRDLRYEAAVEIRAWDAAYNYLKAKADGKLRPRPTRPVA